MKKDELEDSLIRELQELEKRIDRQIRMMIVSKYIMIGTLLYIPFIITLFFLQYFFESLEPFVDFATTFFNGIVILFMIYTNENIKRTTGWNFDGKMKIMRVAFWLLLIFNFAMVANYIVDVFDIRIDFK